MHLRVTYTPKPLHRLCHNFLWPSLSIPMCFHLQPCSSTLLEREFIAIFIKQWSIKQQEEDWPDDMEPSYLPISWPCVTVRVLRRWRPRAYMSCAFSVHMFYVDTGYLFSFSPSLMMRWQQLTYGPFFFSFNVGRVIQALFVPGQPKHSLHHRIGSCRPYSPFLGPARPG